MEREAVSFATLAAEFGALSGPRLRRGATLEAVDGLRRRSLLERGERRSSFALQSVVLEFVTERLIEDASQELQTGELAVLLRLPLVKATAKDYVRRNQERLIAGPLLERLVANYGSPSMAERRLLALLEELRRCPLDEQRYAPGALVNLLRLLRGDLSGVDLSGLAIRQAYLQEVDAQDASLAGSHLAEVLLAEAFKYPTAVTLSADGVYLAGGTSASEVCLWDAETGRLLTIMQGHAGLVYAVALSDDGWLAASAGQDGTVKLWDTASGRLIATLPGHTGGVWGVALSWDGRMAASAGVDGTVRIWEARGGALQHTLRGDRCYERLNIAGLTGVNEAQRSAMLALGAVEHDPDGMAQGVGES